MRILACRNFRTLYPLAHCETFSAALALGIPLALGFPVALDQFLRSSLAQVRGPVAAGRDVRVTNVARTTAPLRAAPRAGHLIAEPHGIAARCNFHFGAYAIP
jgi:hypothetical protein